LSGRPSVIWSLPRRRRRRPAVVVVEAAAADRRFFVVWPLQLLPALPPAIRCPPLRRPLPCAPYLRGWHLGVTCATEGAPFFASLSVLPNSGTSCASSRHILRRYNTKTASPLIAPSALTTYLHLAQDSTFRAPFFCFLYPNNTPPTSIRYAS
jgi:hypothetical protein